MLAIAVVIGATALLDDAGFRTWVWLVVMGGSLTRVLWQQGRRDELLNEAVQVTESMAERFGLFTIIVLGEVVVGVADGLAEQEDRTLMAIVTGFLALGIGFGFWWNYFDFIGRRIPREGTTPRVTWIHGHLTLALAIAAAGAGMVSLVEHAGDARTPAATAWLVTGSVAALAVSLAALVWTMEAHPSRAMVAPLLLVLAVVALIVGAFRPAPWLLALSMQALLMAVWGDAFRRHAQAGMPIAET